MKYIMVSVAWLLMVVNSLDNMWLSFAGESLKVVDYKYLGVELGALGKVGGISYRIGYGIRHETI